MVGVSLALWVTGTRYVTVMDRPPFLLNRIVSEQCHSVGRIIEQAAKQDGLSVGGGRRQSRQRTPATHPDDPLTTVLGMLRLAIGIGEGRKFMRPLALTVVGG